MSTKEGMTAVSGCFVYLLLFLLQKVTCDGPEVRITRPPSVWSDSESALLLPVARPAHLDCTVHNLPRRLTVRWTAKYKSGAIVPLTNVQHPTPVTWRLRLLPLPTEDGTVFTCRVQTGSQSFVGDSISVRVVDAPVIAELESSNDQVASEQSRVLLRCDARAMPPATFTWSRVDGQPINGAQEVKGKALELSRLGWKEAGLYRCLAQNLAGHAQRTIRLSVRYHPRVAAVTSRVHAVIGDDVTLRCDVRSYPTEFFSRWHSPYYGDIQDDNHFHSNRSGTGTEQQSLALTVRSVTAKDAGNYTCYAENSQGYGSDVITVQVSKTRSGDINEHNN